MSNLAETEMTRIVGLDDKGRRVQVGFQQIPKTRRHTKTGRNAPCPCGSGKKTKRCCEELSR